MFPSIGFYIFLEVGKATFTIELSIIVFKVSVLKKNTFDIITSKKKTFLL